MSTVIKIAGLSRTCWCWNAAASMSSAGNDQMIRKCCYFLNCCEETGEFPFHSARAKIGSHKEWQCGTLDSIFLPNESLHWSFLSFIFITPSNLVSTFKKTHCDMKHAHEGVTCDFEEKPEEENIFQRLPAATAWAACRPNMHILLNMHSEMHLISLS